MKNKALRSDTFREIKKTLNRFFSILLIIGLGVGFFVGVKATAPSMKETADSYFTKQNLMDLKVLSTFGFGEEDVAKIKEVKGVKEVVPSYSIDLILESATKKPVVKVMALYGEDSPYAKVNKPVLQDGRLPKAENECLVEASKFKDTGLKIGDTITFSEMAGETHVDEVMKTRVFTVVGTVKSPMYITFAHGTSFVGDGVIDSFILVPVENFTYERFTEVYVSCDKGAVSSFSKEYKKKLEKISEDIKAIGVDSYMKFKEETEGKILSAEAELEKSAREAREQLNSAAAQLDAARSQISSAAARLAEGKNKLAQSERSAVSEIGAADAEIAAARKQLQDANEQLKNGERDYNEGRARLDQEKAAGRAQLDAGWAQYEKGVADLEAGRAKLNDAKNKLAQVEQAIPLVQSQRDSTQKKLDKQIAEGATPEQIAETRQKLAEQDAQLQQLYSARTSLKEGIAKGETDLANGQASLNANKEKLNQGEAQYSQKVSAGEKQLNDAYYKIKNGKAEYNNGIIQLNEAQAQLNKAKQSAKGEIISGRNEIAQGEQQLAVGQRELTENEIKYNQAVKEAESKISDGSRRIQDAKKTISGVDAGLWYVFDRGINPGYSGFSDDAARIDAMAAIFPVFFLLVAVLVCLTTMSRMVEEQRGQIGTLKAMGYSNRDIAEKYFVYSSLAGVVGSIIGIGLGTFFLPKAIMGAYKAMYDLPKLDIVFPWVSCIGAFVLAMLCTTLVALYTCYKELKSRPAQLMRPKAPKEGKRIFLERITGFWEKLSFSHKVTARNLFRYKGRLIMTIIGIAGCTALVTAGMGLQDAISVIVPKQFGEINKYDTIIALRGGSPAEDLADVKETLASTGKFNSYMLTSQVSVKVQDKANPKKSMEVYLYTPESAAKLKDMVDLHERGSTKKLDLKDDGVIVTEKLAKANGLKVGDTIEFTVDDAPYSVKISGITENYVYHYIYMSPALYQKTMGKVEQYNSVIGRTHNVPVDEKSKVSELLLKNEKLTSVNFTDTIKSNFSDQISSLNVVVFIMIGAAGALAFIVLYNLTNINISERVREIATIKVLGFYNKEVNMYVIRENIVMTILGIIVGLILGTFISKFMVATIEMDMVMFGRELDISSYLVAALLTVVFTLLVNVVMSFRMKRISMVDSLKSVE